MTAEDTTPQDSVQEEPKKRGRKKKEEMSTGKGSDAPTETHDANATADDEAGENDDAPHGEQNGETGSVITDSAAPTENTGDHDPTTPPADGKGVDDIAIDTPGSGNVGDEAGEYECIKPCIGKRSYKVGDVAHFDRHPGYNYFKKVGK